MKHEVRRGRKFIEYHDDEQPEGTFTQEISGADVSYQDEAGSWQQLVEDWETDGADGFSFRASRMSHKVRFDSIGAWRWYPRRNVETEYLVINRPQCWLTRTNRWGYLLVNGISRKGKDITITSLRNVTRVIHSRWNGIKTDWILENADAPTRFQQQIDLVGLTEVDGWLYGADGEQVARLTPTTAIDAEGNELPTSTSYENGILEFSADVTGAAFPVVIDPDFAGGTADARIASSNPNYTTMINGHNNESDGTLYCGQLFMKNTYYANCTMELFDTSGIDDDATITQVNLKMVVTADNSTTDFDVGIKKYDWHLGANGAKWDGVIAADYDDAIWRNTNGMSVNTQYASGNLSTAWVNKTGITYYVLCSTRLGVTPPTGAEYIQFADSSHATEAYRPVLTVTYTAGSTGVPKHFLHYARLRSN